MPQNAPIGIFDSGIGGLTVARAVKKLLPSESIIYFGDTAHLPYGDKSTAAIQAYSIKIADFLLKKGCKIILIACNSASSVAYDLMCEYVGKKAKVIDVINPTIQFIQAAYKNQKIGLIGTKKTVESGVYAEKVQNLNQNISLSSLATPLLVPMIEEGFHNNKISQEIISNYLSDESLQEIDALILGCTHYPIIKQEIGEYYQKKSEQVQVIDAAETIAKELQKYLVENQLIANQLVKDEFVVSDYTQSFEATTRIFFGEEVQLAHHAIWN